MIRKRWEDGGIKKLVWKREIGGFGVSHSAVDNVCGFISNQKQHHKNKRLKWKH